MLRTSEQSRSGTEHNPWDRRTIADMLDTRARDLGEAVALVDGDRHISFLELQQLRDGLAAELAARGVREGVPVGVFMAKSWEYVVLLHAIWSLGAVVVPLNTMWRGEEVARALVEADVEAVVVGRAAAGRSIAEVVEGLGLPWGGPVSSARLPRLRTVIAAGVPVDGGTGGEHDLQTLLTTGRGRAPLPRSSRQESLILFSSGSTASPKAVVLRQDGLLGTASYFFRRLGIDAQDRFLSLGPYYHAGGIVQMLGSLLSGAAHYLFDGVDVPRIVDVALADRCTAVTGFDPVLNRILDEIDRRGATVPFTNVGCAPGTDSYQRLIDLGLRPVMMYAMSEGGNIITLTSADELETGRMSNGRPLPGLTVTIRDPGTGQDVPTGAEGEICFRGWNLFRGYYNWSADRFGGALVTDDDDLFHTEDIGHLDAEGRLYYTGRYASMIKTGGENVSAVEVERFLVDAFPDVVTAAVVGVPDPAWGEAVVAFVELAPGSQPLDEAAFRAACRDRLAGYKIPKRVVEVGAGAWPMTESGKLLKAVLQDKVADPSLTVRPV